MNEKLQEFISKLADLMEGYDACIEALMDFDDFDEFAISVRENGKESRVELNTDWIDSYKLRNLIKQ